MTQAFHFILALLLAPMMASIINRTKALVAGRQAPSWLQPYWDLQKLAGKGAVYSDSAGFFFRLLPPLGLAAAVVNLLLVPMAGQSFLSFSGDFVLFIYLFALWRFVMVLASWETASSFEGMGASREAQFAVLAETGLILALAVQMVTVKGLTLEAMFSNPVPDSRTLMVVATMALLFLVENCRVPFDDPDTHLELTMIHEVMVLDHSGPDFGMILYAAQLKMWILGSFLVGLIVPFPSTLVFLVAMGFLAIAVGLVESLMARLRLITVPRLLLGAVVSSALALLLGAL